MRKTALLLATCAIAVLAFAMPSGATVHEIVGQWCAGKGALEPKGISDPAKAKTFARPLMANGVASVVPNFDGNGNTLIQFDFEHPAIKVVPTGAIVPLFPGAPVYITQWTTDDDFPAFQHCPGYVSHTEP